MTPSDRRYMPLCESAMTLAAGTFIQRILTSSDLDQSVARACASSIESTVDQNGEAS